MEKKVYLDNAAATPVRKEVIEEMMPFFDAEFGNPSTVYDMGSRIKAVVDVQRAKVAELIGARPEEIIFTSGGTEANNLAIKGIAFAHRKKGNHIIVAATEHHSVLNSARFFERLDYEVTFLKVDEYGLVDPQRIRELIRPETILISIAYASNEIGTIQPIAKIAEVCKDKGVFFHTDGVATVGNIPVDVKQLGVDLLSLSGIPLEAPKGTGALYFRKGLRLMPLLHGGIQESGRRGGTENVPGIVGLGKAAELTLQELPQKMRHVKVLRDKLVSGVIESIESVKLTGHPETRLPGHASFCVQAIEGEALVFMLSSEGIYVNTGSACASKALKTSPVLLAIGIPPELAQGSIVFTLDVTNTEEDIDYVLEKLPFVVGRLRSMSPLWGKKETAQASS
ncbi:MAG: cysteine desulfurase [Deltaproteobacteria bacterium]|nr:cysteine desulfurase [Deltaproteobacteria bacterium]MBW1930809.1 cysteine desulfurase [Deltaproteobacteria bacterium]MBW2024710.1 cysteine desulfurase [Deltaproteobacteria bacterium]MBW2125485.1 cysteine desulfurase [Deltaproteobacteria bacterium]